MIPKPHYYVYMDFAEPWLIYRFRRFYRDGRYYSGCIGGCVKPHPLDHTQELRARYF